jgi:hypothetical protein
MVIPPNYTVALATVVRERVEAAGHTAHSLADTLHIPYQTLRRSLAGDQNMRVEHIAAIANLLGCEVSDFTLVADRASAA